MPAETPEQRNFRLLTELLRGKTRREYTNHAGATLLVESLTPRRIRLSRLEPTDSGVQVRAPWVDFLVKRDKATPVRFGSELAGGQRRAAPPRSAR